MQHLYRPGALDAHHQNIGLFARLLLALALLPQLTGWQAPPPTATGSGEIEILVTTLSGAPVAGLTVRYLDEWQRQPYGVCTTDTAGRCLLVVQDAPALHDTLRGQLDTGVARRRDIVLLADSRVRMALTLDRDGSLVTGGTDVLATRDPFLTPTLISPEAALATLTAVAGQGIATPSPGIERTIAAAHARMSATAAARDRNATPTPTVTLTLEVTGTIGTEPDVAEAPGAIAPEEDMSSMTRTPMLAILPIVALLMVMFALLWWRRRSQTGGAP